MSDKTKNIISNTIGVVLILLALLFYIGEQVDEHVFYTLLGIGVILFFFKVSETVAFIKKFLNKKLKWFARLVKISLTATIVITAKN